MKVSKNGLRTLVYSEDTGTVFVFARPYHRTCSPPSSFLPLSHADNMNWPIKLGGQVCAFNLNRKPLFFPREGPACTHVVTFPKRSWDRCCHSWRPSPGIFFLSLRTSALHRYFTMPIEMLSIGTNERNTKSGWNIKIPRLFTLL